MGGGGQHHVAAALLPGEFLSIVQEAGCVCVCVRAAGIRTCETEITEFTGNNMIVFYIYCAYY